jgi:hypothetical protein
MRSTAPVTKDLKVRQPQRLEQVEPMPLASEEDVRQASRVLASLQDLAGQAVEDDGDRKTS